MDDFGDQQRLAFDPLFFALGFHLFQHKPFMSGVLVNDHEAGFRLCDDIVGVHLRLCCAKGKGAPFFECGFRLTGC